MKRAVVGLLCLFVGCASSEPKHKGARVIVTYPSGETTTRYVHPLKAGHMEDIGGGFYVKTIRAKSKGFESECWSSQLYYGRYPIEGAGGADISPTGRYALYSSGVYDCLVLFDTRDRIQYKVLLNCASGPYEVVWDENGGKFEFSYYPAPYRDDDYEKVTVRISDLVPVSASCPPSK